ncbi:Dihydrofolate reductase [compost metagenome]
MDKNGLIGDHGKLPWSLPADLAYFKQKTMGYPVIMGRKTYESIGKPLPGRENIILTRDKDFKADGCNVVNESFKLQFRSDVGFVIGGSEIFSMYLDEADKLFITHIDYEFTGDTYFPEIDFGKWEIELKINGIKDEKNPYDYYFAVYKRVNKKTD